jgi:hypothetical protein
MIGVRMKPKSNIDNEKVFKHSSGGASLRSFREAF